MGVVVILPSSGINYLWQLSELVKIAKTQEIDAIYACSGGAWATMFLSLGIEVAEAWLKEAPNYMESWTRQNQYNYRRKTTVALKEDAREIFEKLNFFSADPFPIQLFVRVCEVYPEPGIRIVDVSKKSREEIFDWAIASSTVPGVTGAYAQIDNTYYVDGGVWDYWTTEEIHPNDRMKKRIVIDTWGRSHEAASSYIYPEKPLGHGLKIALPRVFKQSYFKAKIDTPGVQA